MSVLVLKDKIWETPLKLQDLLPSSICSIKSPPMNKNFSIRTGTTETKGYLWVDVWRVSCIFQKYCASKGGRTKLLLKEGHMKNRINLRTRGKGLLVGNLSNPIQDPEKAIELGSQFHVHPFR